MSTLSDILSRQQKAQSIQQGGDSTLRKILNEQNREQQQMQNEMKYGMNKEIIGDTPTPTTYKTPEPVNPFKKEVPRYFDPPYLQPKKETTDDGQVSFSLDPFKNDFGSIYKDNKLVAVKLPTPERLNEILKSGGSIPKEFERFYTTSPTTQTAQQQSGPRILDFGKDTKEIYQIPSPNFKDAQIGEDFIVLPEIPNSPYSHAVIKNVPNVKVIKKSLEQGAIISAPQKDEVRFQAGPGQILLQKETPQRPPEVEEAIREQEKYSKMSEVEKAIYSENLKQAFWRKQRQEERLKGKVTGQKPADYVEPTTAGGQLWEGLVNGFGYQMPRTLAGTLESFGNEFDQPQWREWGEQLGDRSLARILNNPQLQRPEDLKPFFEGGIVDPRWYGRTLGDLIPTVAVSFGAATAGGLMTRNPGVVAGIMRTTIFAQEAGSAYNEYLDNGLSPDSAAHGALIYGIVATELEQLVQFRIGSKLLTPRQTDYIKGSFLDFLKKEAPKTVKIEMGTEGAQQFSQNLVGQYIGDNVELFNNVLESMAAGGLGGGVFVGGEAIIDTYRGRYSELESFKKLSPIFQNAVNRITGKEVFKVPDALKSAKLRDTVRKIESDFESGVTDDITQADIDVKQRLSDYEESNSVRTQVSPEVTIDTVKYSDGSYSSRISVNQEEGISTTFEGDYKTQEDAMVGAVQTIINTGFVPESQGIVDALQKYTSVENILKMQKDLQDLKEAQYKQAKQDIEAQTKKKLEELKGTIKAPDTVTKEPEPVKKEGTKIVPQEAESLVTAEIEAIMKKNEKGEKLTNEENLKLIEQKLAEIRSGDVTTQEREKLLLKEKENIKRIIEEEKKLAEKEKVKAEEKKPEPKEPVTYKGISKESIDKLAKEEKTTTTAAITLTAKLLKKGATERVKTAKMEGKIPDANDVKISKAPLIVLNRLVKEIYEKPTEQQEKTELIQEGRDVLFTPKGAKIRKTGTVISLPGGYVGVEVKNKDGSISIYEYKTGQYYGDYNSKSSSYTKKDILDNFFKKQKIITPEEFYKDGIDYKKDEVIAEKEIDIDGNKFTYIKGKDGYSFYHKGELIQKAKTITKFKTAIKKAGKQKVDSILYQKKLNKVDIKEVNAFWDSLSDELKAQYIKEKGITATVKEVEKTTSYNNIKKEIFLDKSKPTEEETTQGGYKDYQKDLQTERTNFVEKHKKTLLEKDKFGTKDAELTVTNLINDLFPATAGEFNVTIEGEGKDISFDIYWGRNKTPKEIQDIFDVLNPNIELKDIKDDKGNIREIVAWKDEKKLSEDLEKIFDIINKDRLTKVHEQQQSIFENSEPEGPTIKSETDFNNAIPNENYSEENFSKTSRTIQDIINNQKDGTEALKEGEREKGWKISKEAKKIVDSFGVPIAERTFERKSVLGVYKHIPRKVRVKAMFDLIVITHEVTHAIDHKHNITEKFIAATRGKRDKLKRGKRDKLKDDLTKKRDNKLKDDLTNIYVKYYYGGNPNAAGHPLQKRITEGIATLIENYFYDPVTITEEYPDLVKEFLQPEGRYYNSEFTRLLTEMNTLVADYSKLSETEKVAARIRTGEEVIAKDSGFDWKQKFVFEFFNKFEPLARYAKNIPLDKLWNNPMVQVFNVMRKNAIVAQYIEGGVMPILQADGTYTKKEGGIKKYVDLVQGKERAFEAYLIARRVVATYKKKLEFDKILDMWKQDSPDVIAAIIRGDTRFLVENNVPVKWVTDIKFVMQQIVKYHKILEKDKIPIHQALDVVKTNQKQFKEAEEAYDDVNKALLEVAYNTGLINEKNFVKWSNEKGYASFKRYIEDNLSGSVGTVDGKAFTKVSSFLERTGSDFDFLSPLYSQFLAIYEIHSKGYNNLLWQRVADLAFQQGEKGNPELARRFEDVTKQPAVDSEGKLVYSQEGNSQFVKVLHNGTKRFYKVGEEFRAVISAMETNEVDGFAYMLMKAGGLFTRFTTSANPYFALGNFSVDQFTRMSQTKLKTTGKDVAQSAQELVVGGIMDFIEKNPFLSGKIDLSKYQKNPELLKEYLSLGGQHQTLANFLDVSPEVLIENIAGRKEGVIGKTINVINQGLEVLEIPSNFSEIATRFAEYARAIEAGYPQSVAMYLAADVTTPFQLQGNNFGRTGRVFVKSIPFFNAILQVTYKYGRTAAENPQQLATVYTAVAFAGITLAIAIMQSASDEQKRLLANQNATELSKAIFIPSPNGKSLWRLRIPEQIGSLIGVVNLFVISQYGHNKAIFDDYLEASTTWLPSQLNITQPKEAFFSLIPKFLQPSVFVIADTRTYPELGPIVPPYMKDLPAELQYSSYTSEVAKFIGGLVGGSPILVDYWIKEQFGQVGKFVTSGKTPNNPLFRDEEGYVMRGRAYNNFYEQRDVAEKNKALLKDNPKKYSNKEAERINLDKKLYNEMADVLAIARQLDKHGIEITEKVRDSIYKQLLVIDTYRTPEEYSKAMGLIDQVRGIVGELAEKNLSSIPGFENDVTKAINAGKLKKYIDEWTEMEKKGIGSATGFENKMRKDIQGPKPTAKDKARATRFVEDFRLLKGFGYGHPYVTELTSAKSNEDKALILIRLESDLPPAEFKDFMNKAKSEEYGGLVSTGGKNSTYTLYNKMRRK